MTNLDDDPSPFIDWLEGQRDGALLLELDQAFKDLNLDVAHIGKAGTLTITVRVEQVGRSLTIADDIRTKPPRPDRGSDVWFADAAGELHKDDPNAPRLPLASVVDLTTGEIKAESGD